MSLVKISAALRAQLDTVPAIIPAVAFTAAAGAPAVFSTPTPHGLVTGVPVRFVGYAGGTPALAGVYLANVLSAKSFGLLNTGTRAPISATIAGTGGSVLALLTTERNTLYQNVAGVPYQIVDLVPFRPDEPTQGAGYYREQGVFQVTLVYPAGVGMGAILARAELIRSFFKKGTSFSYDGVTVLIPSTPEVGHFPPGSPESLELSVKISYQSDIFV